MIRFAKGNLLQADAEALVNTVNCVGVMGKGIALQFKKAFPENFKAYVKACKNNSVIPGKMFVVPTGSLFGTKYIINFPTKMHWKENSKIEYLQAGLNDLVAIIKQLNVQSIAIPPLGCGNGGLDWNVVLPLITERLKVLDNNINIMIYVPADFDRLSVVNTAIPELTIFKATLLKLVERYIYWEDSLTRIEIQKLCYFQKAAGDPNFERILFSQNKYGPYARNLAHTIHDMDGHYLMNCGDNENPYRSIYPADGAVQKATDFLVKNSPNTQTYLDRVFKLIDGFETPFGMELLSSVHWVAHRKNAAVARTLQEAVDYVRRWNDRKEKTFSPEHIEIAWTRLRNQGWIKE